MFKLRSSVVDCCDETLSLSVVSLPDWLWLLVALDLKSDVARTSQTDFLLLDLIFLLGRFLSCEHEDSPSDSFVDSPHPVGSDDAIGSTCTCPVGKNVMILDRALSWTTRSWYSSFA